MGVRTVDITTLDGKIENLIKDGTSYSKNFLFRLLDPNNRFNITVCNSPLHNCQIFTVGGIEALLSNTDNPKDVLKYIWSRSGQKNIVMFDVRGSYCTMLEKVFPKGELISKQEYITTYGAGHTRYIYLFNTRSFK